MDRIKLNVECIKFYNNSNVQTDEFSSQYDLVWQFAYNAKYRIDGKLSGKASVSNGFICMEGRVYNKAQDHLYREALHDKIWLTYRKSFAPLLIE